MLPVSAAGLLLMLLAAGFFVAEAFIVSHGALALAGAIMFVIGALMLFDPAGDAYQVSMPVALAIAGTLALLFGLALTKAAQVRRTPVAVGVAPARRRARRRCATRTSSSSTASSGTRAAPTARRSSPATSVPVEGVEPETLELVVGSPLAEPTAARHPLPKGRDPWSR